MDVQEVVSEKRKTFVAREDLLNRMSDIAKWKGKSLYETVNEMFEIAISLQKLGIMPKSALEECRRLKLAKDSGYVLCLENLWFDLNAIAYSSAQTETIGAWKSAGIWYAKKHATSGAKDPLVSIKADLESSLWSISEFSMVREGDVVSVRMLSPRLSKAYSELLIAFFEGIFEVLGFEVSEREAMSGSVNLRANKGKERAIS